MTHRLRRQHRRGAGIAPHGHVVFHFVVGVTRDDAQAFGKQRPGFQLLGLHFALPAMLRVATSLCAISYTAAVYKALVPGGQMTLPGISCIQKGFLYDSNYHYRHGERLC
ncbi:hypothetical protein [Lonsdalea iberica]|uniref:Uncharacterized protein n=1 Tax=Lonsdalea iberica TaxID=1082703 RepID=A0A1X3RR40_9GAMM|nr:hypothetical protein [Lonsdalea iberica]OSN04235.1 hypothetical protein AU511_12980 [Lonsdalea iberica]